MQPETVKLLWDMHAAATRIGRFSVGKTAADYDSDDLLRSAIERQFEIIGEAMTRLIKADRATALLITDYRKIASFRNVLIHGYDSIDNEVSWAVVTTKLPVLCEDLQRLLGT